MTAELIMKYGGNYFNTSGRKEDGTDATNELSWLLVEAYDMVGGHQCMNVLWHKDINRDFFASPPKLTAAKVVPLPCSSIRTFCARWSSIPATNRKTCGTYAWAAVNGFVCRARNIVIRIKIAW